MGLWKYTDGTLKHSDYVRFVYTTSLSENRKWVRLAEWVADRQPQFDAATIKRMTDTGTNTQGYNAICTELEKLQAGIVDRITSGENPQLPSLQANNIKCSVKINFDPTNASDTAKLYKVLSELESLRSVTLEPIVIDTSRK